MKQESEQFKVEATPVIDLKKSPVSDMWDNEKTEVYLEDEAGGTAFLLTSEGDYIPISAFPFVIGRGNECDLVLNKKGMSRKHAEIVFQSGRFVVNDLDSLNGLKVNGYKVARVILEEGDSIKLGEVTLVFTASKSGSESKTASAESTPTSNPFGGSTQAASGSGRKVLYGLAAVSLLAIAGAGVYSMMGNSLMNVANQRIVSVPNPTATSQNQEKVEEVAAASSTEKAVASAATSPAAAEVPASEVAVDPTAPPPSIALAPSAKGPSAPPAPADEPLPPPVVPKAPVKPEPVKPAAVAKVVQQPKAASKVVQPAKPLVASPAPVAIPIVSSTSNIDARYLSGDVDGLLREMNQAIKGNRSGDTAYRNKYSAISSMYSKYAAGKQAFLEGRQAEAFNQWSAFIAEEKALFGAKRSVMASASISKMADGYAALGNEAAKTGKNHEAYKYWQKSLSYGDSVAARIALDAANQKSKQLYRQALRLEYVNTERAKELWKQVMDTVPPGTEYYTKASSKLAWYDKWGA